MMRNKHQFQNSARNDENHLVDLSSNQDQDSSRSKSCQTHKIFKTRLHFCHSSELWSPRHVSHDITKVTKLQTLNFSAKNNQKEMSTYQYSSILLENQKLLTHTVVTLQAVNDELDHKWALTSVTKCWHLNGSVFGVDVLFLPLPISLGF